MKGIMLYHNVPWQIETYIQTPTDSETTDRAARKCMCTFPLNRTQLDSHRQRLQPFPQGAHASTINSFICSSSALLFLSFLKGGGGLFLPFSFPSLPSVFLCLCLFDGAVVKRSFSSMSAESMKRCFVALDFWISFVFVFAAAALLLLWQEDCCKAIAELSLRLG